MKVEGSKTTVTDWLLDMIDAFHNFREGLFEHKQRPRLWVTSVGF
jgi:hypothetical protein